MACQALAPFGELVRDLEHFSTCCGCACTLSRATSVSTRASIDFIEDESRQQHATCANKSWRRQDGKRFFSAPLFLERSRNEHCGLPPAHAGTRHATRRLKTGRPFTPPFIRMCTHTRIAHFLTIWTMSSSIRTWALPHFCGWCLHDLPHTHAYLNCFMMFRWILLQNSSIVGASACKMTGSP